MDLNAGLETAASVLPGSDGWEMPAFETALFCPRRYAHALVVPVVNEGGRQLEDAPCLEVIGDFVVRENDGS